MLRYERARNAEDTLLRQPFLKNTIFPNQGSVLISGKDCVLGCDPVLPLMRARGKFFWSLFEGNQTIEPVNRDPPIQNEQKYANTSDLLTSVYMALEQGERIWILKVGSTPGGDVWRAFVLVPGLILPPTGAVSFALILKTA